MTHVNSCHARATAMYIMCGACCSLEDLNLLILSVFLFFIQQMVYCS
jgi:hypothetical protein